MQWQNSAIIGQALLIFAHYLSSTLWKALFVAYGRPYAIAAGLKIIQDFLAFLQPQLLRVLLLYISAYQNSRFGYNHPSDFQGFAIAVLMFVASIIQTVCLNQVCQIPLFSPCALLIPCSVFPTMLRNWVRNKSMVQSTIIEFM